eukprot:scaffold501_cov407-Prasinococcus_capsulatus_cf.AAC.13
MSPLPPCARELDLITWPGPGLTLRRKAMRFEGEKSIVHKLTPFQTGSSQGRGGNGSSGVCINAAGYLVATYRCKDVYLFNARSPKTAVADSSHGAPVCDTPLQVYRGAYNHKTFLKEVEFFCGGEYVVTGSDKGTINIWETDSGLLSREIEADSYTVNSIAVHPFLPIIATSGIDNDARVWMSGGQLEVGLPSRFPAVYPYDANLAVRQVEGDPKPDFESDDDFSSPSNSEEESQEDLDDESDIDEEADADGAGQDEDTDNGEEDEEMNRHLEETHVELEEDENHEADTTGGDWEAQETLKRVMHQEDQGGVSVAEPVAMGLSTSDLVSACRSYDHSSEGAAHEAVRDAPTKAVDGKLKAGHDIDALAEQELDRMLGDQVAERSRPCTKGILKNVGDMPAAKESSGVASGACKDSPTATVDAAKLHADFSNRAAIVFDDLESQAKRTASMCGERCLTTGRGSESRKWTVKGLVHYPGPTVAQEEKPPEEDVYDGEFAIEAEELVGSGETLAYVRQQKILRANGGAPSGRALGLCELVDSEADFDSNDMLAIGVMNMECFTHRDTKVLDNSVWETRCERSEKRAYTEVEGNSQGVSSDSVLRILTTPERASRAKKRVRFTEDVIRREERKPVEVPVNTAFARAMRGRSTNGTSAIKTSELPSGSSRQLGACFTAATRLPDYLVNPQSYTVYSLDTEPDCPGTQAMALAQCLAAASKSKKQAEDGQADVNAEEEVAVPSMPQFNQPIGHRRRIKASVLHVDARVSLEVGRI